MPLLICHQQSSLVGVQPFCSVYKLISGPLANGDDHAVRRVKLFCSRNLLNGAVFFFLCISKDDPFIGNLYRYLTIDKFYPFQQCIIIFMLATVDVLEKH